MVANNNKINFLVFSPILPTSFISMKKIHNNFYSKLMPVAMINTKTKRLLNYLEAAVYENGL